MKLVVYQGTNQLTKQLEIIKSSSELETIEAVVVENSLNTRECKILEEIPQGQNFGYIPFGEKNKLGQNINIYI